jgi:hypothetical protein
LKYETQLFYIYIFYVCVFIIFRYHYAIEVSSTLYPHITTRLNPDTDSVLNRAFYKLEELFVLEPELLEKRKKG